MILYEKINLLLIDKNLLLVEALKKRENIGKITINNPIIP